jgi:hypothetical protein
MAKGRVLLETRFVTLVALSKAVVVVVDAVETDILDSVGAAVIGVPFIFFDNVCKILLLLFDSDFTANVVVVVVVITAAASVVFCDGNFLYA